MSLFRFAKYSTLLFFLGKYKTRIFRIVAVLLFAAVTSLLYQDVAEYLQREHPGTVIYALLIKILIVYGALAFVLWQFRPAPDSDSRGAGTVKSQSREGTSGEIEPRDRLSQLEDVREHDRLASRYTDLLSKK